MFLNQTGTLITDLYLLIYIHKNTGGQIYGPQAEYEIQSNKIQSNESAFNLRKMYVLYVSLILCKLRKSMCYVYTLILNN